MSARSARLGRRAAWVLGGVAVLAQITYPLTQGSARDDVSVAVVLLLAAACTVHAASTRGLQWTAGLLAVTAVGGFLVEMLGTATGFPFGAYDYATGRLGPTVSTVPVIIGLAWTAGAYPAWCAASTVAGGARGRRLLLATVGLAAWDLYLDPQMVADGRWTWMPGSATLPFLDDIPVSNYLGWVLTAAVMVAALEALPQTRPDRLQPDELPLALYLWTWLGSALAHAVFLDLPASAVYGFVAMGLLGVPLLRALLRGGATHGGGQDHRRAEVARPARRGGRLARWARAPLEDPAAPHP
ncbi:carotenoid biosynthesis protein [Rhodococcus sp. X156]|uniref:carotenoid biosynthesis protein n=1 Tax=Rhodococcus sp. X156 TaxID=2499145 RepID=UPI001F49A89B|nr:carotenoid biosynthesis protein [Rhodococcus sp. X156]